jgi:L-ascorbate metabolism protein UlaG (beta-lactamase superfamily)
MPLVLAGCSREALTAITEIPVTPTITTEPSIAIYFEEYAQVELIGPDGTRVLIDVYDPTLLSSPATPDDILLTTHNHDDHVNEEFRAGFEGKELYIREGEITRTGVTIRGIASAHNSRDDLLPEGGSNYIYLIEMGGLRIAHLGDIGQDALTQEQLDDLGRVDIVITQFVNDASDMTIFNRKAFHLIEQINPRLIIPTHISVSAAEEAWDQWAVAFDEDSLFTISRSALPVETTILFLGNITGKGYRAIYEGRY